MEDRNPSPPPEFEKSEIYRADSVGGSVISKQWVLATLMEIINETKKHSENKEEGPLEVSDELQDSACKLWDICMDQDVAVFLMDFDIIDILYGVILKSKSPRLTEISVGILGNMACSNAACEAISKLEHLRSVVIALLASPDTETLIEAVRFIKICVSNSTFCQDWLKSICKDLEEFIQNAKFILSSSTNGKLLASLSEVLDLLFEYDPDVLAACTNDGFVGALSEAVEQQSKDDPSNSLHSLCHSLHALHCISETDKGKLIFVSSRRSIIALLSTLCYQWMTSHPKVEYNNESKMSSSEVSVSCCLSLASCIFEEERSPPDSKEEEDQGAVKKEENEEEKKPEEVDDEDRQLIIKFAESVVAAKGVISALSVVMTLASEDGSQNEFKTPLHVLKNSPRISTPVVSLTGKNSEANSFETPIQSPELSKPSPNEKTPTSGAAGDFTPTARDRDGADKSDNLPPATVLCDLANRVLKSTASQVVLANGESPRKEAT